MEKTQGKKDYYVGRYRTELADSVKALRILNEFLADETLDLEQRAEISRELARIGGEKDAN